MDRDDPFDIYMREYQKLSGDWTGAYMRHENAKAYLVGALARLGTGDPRFESPRGHIAQVKQALGALRQIEEQMVKVLERIDAAAS